MPTQLATFLFTSGACFLLLAVFATACGAQDRTPGVESACLPLAEERTFDPDGWETNFCKHSVPYDEIFSGGPPRDGIPPLDTPRFVPVAAADAWIADDEPVLYFEHGGMPRAYPLQIMTWHEIVNDHVGGLPVVVTFCPLCNAAIVFERPEIEGKRLTFGTSGNLRHSDLIMWDRQTESWWQQFTGEAIVGDLMGKHLKSLPASIIAWRTFKEEHPKGEVLSRETGYDRPYGRNPYVGYDDGTQRPFLYRGPVGERLPPMARVVGVILDEEARAYPLKQLREARVINDTLGGTPLVVFWQSGTASALDQAQIAGSRDIGTTGVFRRQVSGRTLRFTPRDGGGFIDDATGSTWNILGESVEGPLAGHRLEPLVHHDIFWFVWSAFQPEGQLYIDATRELATPQNPH